MDDEREARAARAKVALSRARAILEKPAPTVEPKKTSWGERRPPPHYEERLERFVQGDRRALDGWMDEPMPQQPPTVLNAGQRQVRASLEQQRPTLDDETMKLWDAWAERIIWRELQTHLIPDMLKIIHDESDALNEHTVEDITATDERLREDISNLRESMMQELRKDLVGVFNEVLREMGLNEEDGNVIDLPNPIGRKA